MLAQRFDPSKRYGEVDDLKVFARVTSPMQRLAVVLTSDHEGYHTNVGLGHLFVILHAIPAVLERQVRHVPIQIRVQYGVEYLHHHGMILQYARHGHRVLSMTLHLHVKGVQSPR